MSPAAADRSSSGGAEEYLENWSALFAQLASRYGWTPNEMSWMTIAQLVFYAQVGSVAEPESVGMNRAEAIRLAQRKHQQRTAELARLQEALFDEP